MLYALCAALSLALLGLDQWVKHYVTVNIPGGCPALSARAGRARTVHNYGAAWSSFSGMRWPAGGGHLRHCDRGGGGPAPPDRPAPLGVAAGFLILSGGVGNIIDRVRLGYVVDMFHLEFWPSYPVFNVADICVVCGAVLAVIYYLWFYEKYDKRGKAHGDADAPSES